MNNVANNTQKKSLVRFLSLIAGFIVFFHILFFILVSKGTLVQLLNRTDRLEFQAQKQMWDQTRKKIKFESLFIGDEAFIDMVKNLSPECDCAYILVPYYQFNNIGEVFRMIKKNQFKNIFLQNKLHFWTNLNNIGSEFYLKQNVEAYSAYLRYRSLKALGTTYMESLVFTLPKALLSKKTETLQTIEIKHIEPLWFRSNPRGLSAIKKLYTSFNQTNLYWVNDPIPNLHSETDLIQGFKNLTKNQSIGLGQIVEQNQVKQLVEAK